MTSPTRGTRVMRLRDGVAGWSADRLAVEEPLELRVGGQTLAVTMRTPGDDHDLAVGFLLSEGVVTDASEVLDLSACTSGGGGPNTLNVELAGAVPIIARRFGVTSACGLCGTSSADAVCARSRWEVRDDPLRLRPDVLAALPERLRERQAGFARTGGLHAAAAVDGEGRLVCVREDVGRHNAVDKVVGWAARAGLLPLRSHLLLVTSRASFELVQKALLAGMPAIAAVSAPSSLAVELARSSGMTLVGFLRGDTMSVYSGVERIPDESVPAAG